MKKWEGIEIEFQEGAFWFWLFALSEFYYRSSWLDHSRIKSVMLYWEILRPIHFCFCWILVSWRKCNETNCCSITLTSISGAVDLAVCCFNLLLSNSLNGIQLLFSIIRRCKGIGVLSDPCILRLKNSLIRNGEMNGIFYQAFTPLGANAPDFSGFLIFILHTVKNAYFQDN